MEEIIFVRPTIELKKMGLEYREEHFKFGEKVIDGAALLDELDYEEWLDRVNSNWNEETLRRDGVLSHTFFIIRKNDNRIIGIVDMRLELKNEITRRYGGHVGYSVRPSERKKGYATKILNMAKDYLYNLGITCIMVSCYSDNIASEKVILKNGGVLDRKVDFNNKLVHVYYILKEGENFRFKLIYPNLEYKKQAEEYIEEFYEYNSNINGVGGLDRFSKDSTYEEWLVKIDNDLKREVTEQKVPTKTMFLIRENDDMLVGVINIRLALNEKLRKRNGNIGYSIRPTQRGKGYNKINLYLALCECKKYGIKKVMLDCEKSNLGSSKTIISLGGVLEREYLDEELNEMEQVYWIDVDKSVEEKYDLYKEFLADRK